MVTALRELRAHTPYPQGLADYLVPQTNTETLASLSWQIESLLADDRVDEAVELALAVVTMLQQITPRVVEINPDLGAMSSLVEQVRQDIVVAVPDK